MNALVTTFDHYGFEGSFNKLSKAAPPSKIMVRPSSIVKTDPGAFFTSSNSASVAYTLYPTKGTFAENIFIIEVGEQYPVETPAKTSLSVSGKFFAILTLISLAAMAVGLAVGFLYPGKITGIIFPLGVTLFFIITMIVRNYRNRID